MPDYPLIRANVERMRDFATDSMAEEPLHREYLVTACDHIDTLLAEVTENPKWKNFAERVLAENKELRKALEYYGGSKYGIEIWMRKVLSDQGECARRTLRYADLLRASRVDAEADAEATAKAEEEAEDDSLRRAGR